MGLSEMLIRDADAIVSHATEALCRSHLEHYEEEGAEICRHRMTALFELTLRAVAERNPDTLIAYAERVGRERFTAGYDLYEVQRAINALEETLWRHILETMEPPDFAQSIGLVSTILGLTKDALGRTYVALASRTHATSLDLRSSFQRASGT